MTIKTISRDLVYKTVSAYNELKSTDLVDRAYKVVERAAAVTKARIAAQTKIAIEKMQASQNEARNLLSEAAAMKKTLFALGTFVALGAIAYTATRDD